MRITENKNTGTIIQELLYNQYDTNTQFKTTYAS